MEGNNALTNATLIANGQSVAGQLSSGSDSDYFKLNVSDGGTISIDFSAPSTNCSGYNCWVVSIVDSAGTVLAQGATTSTVTALSTGVLAAGDYYLRIQAGHGSYYSQNRYSVIYSF